MSNFVYTYIYIVGLIARYRDRYRFYEQNYEARIDALQRQVEEQSMTMSMYSSYTPEDFNNIEEDIFGEYGKTGNGRFWFSNSISVWLCPDRSGVFYPVV